jgi:hypothetical protein
METSRALCLAMLLGASGVLLAATRPVPPIELTYLGNQGVLLAVGGQQVAIDALHRESRVRRTTRTCPSRTARSWSAPRPRSTALMARGQRGFDVVQVSGSGLAASSMTA